MLSRVLASASSTPIVPAHQSKTMITGRVCKNILGLFSNGAKETLEVKLRLVPVPTCMQNEYVQSMERNRSLNKSMLFEGLDQGGVASPGQFNDNLQSEMAEDSGLSGNFRNDTGDMESLQHLLMGGAAIDNSLANVSMQRDGTEMASVGFHDNSRKASPAPSNRSQHNNAQNGDNDVPPRPLSSCSMPSNTVGAGLYSGNDSFSDAFEDGPARKRACLTKTQWRGRGSFGYNHESLRVTASSAASMRVHRPVPKRHSTSLSDADVDESGFRPPTPRPNEKRFSLDKDRLANRSSLRQVSSFSGAIENTNTRAESQQHHTLPAPFADFPHACAESRPSPESVAGNSPEGTMTDIPSSPPIFAHRTVSPAPSSPQLPSLPKFADSGYMSSNFERDNEEEKPIAESVPPTDVATIDNRESHVTNSALQRLGGKGRAPVEPPSSSCTFLEETPGPPELLPTVILPRNPNYRPPRYHSPQHSNGEEKNPPSTQTGSQVALNRKRSKAAPVTTSNVPSLNTLPTSSPLMTKAEIAKPPTSAMAFPPNPPPNQLNPARLFRSASSASANGWQSENHDKSAAEDNEERYGKQRSGSGAKRRKAIERRLADSIAGGTMPPYCMNCGAIETPTWRRAVGRIVQGSPRNLQLSEMDGEILTCEILERREDGEVTKFRAISKFVGQDNRPESKMLQFCNRKFNYFLLLLLDVNLQSMQWLTSVVACGLYLNKMKCMRPPEKWAKASEPSTKRRGPYKRRKGKNGETEPQSDCMTDSLQKTQGQTSPAREPDEPSNDQVVEQLPQRKRQRASSVEPRAQSSENKTQWNGPAAAAAFRRAIQSSPPRLVGTAKTPIEIDAELTPKPTRRLLFPSPRRQGEMKSLDDREKSKSNEAERASPSKVKTHLAEVMYQNVMNDMNNDKENCPPPSQLSVEQDDEYAELFMDSAPDFQMISSNFTNNSHNNNNSTTTPSRSVTSLLFDPLKTPKSRNSASTINSSARKKRAPLEATSNGSTGKHVPARRHSIELSTPSRSAKRQQQQQPQQLGGSAVTASMTPLTASLYHIFSTGDDEDDMNMTANQTILNPWTSPSQPFGFPDTTNAGSNCDFPFATAKDNTPTGRRFANILNMNMGMGMGMDSSDLHLHDENYSYGNGNGSGNDDSGIFATVADEDLFSAAGLSLTGAGMDVSDGTVTAAAAAAAASPSMTGLFSLYEDPVDDAVGNGYGCDERGLEHGTGGDGSCSGSGDGDGDGSRVFDVPLNQFQVDGVSGAGRDSGAGTGAGTGAGAGAGADDREDSRKGVGDMASADTDADAGITIEAGPDPEIAVAVVKEEQVEV